MSQVEAQCRGHQFPFVESADKTWKHAVETLKAADRHDGGDPCCSENFVARAVPRQSTHSPYRG